MGASDIDVTLKYFVNDIEFPDIVTYFKIQKARENMTLKRQLEIFDKTIVTPDGREIECKYGTKPEEVERYWEETPAITAKEALSFSNAEQRALALEYLGPEEWIGQVNAEMIDKQTVKKQYPTYENVIYNKNGRPMVPSLKASEKVYEDVYELYRIPAKQFNMPGLEDIKVVKCSCASTAQVFYLTVEPHLTDAIDAIASTYQKPDGSRMSKRDYMRSIGQET